ncbi:M28 family peptidase [Segetibacter sp. 3557_3]|uniref:M28 family peptidase n=1 Tax=Segetibacter sp. 3557_3 TaxID=2547429 RepID=UPI00105901F2|nr:M28 family peptidase [Segetibacter sp. 3557_3]TDH28877.1 M28 family peptidase [Segetibacter sp. 3557_3]
MHNSAQPLFIFICLFLSAFGCKSEGLRHEEAYPDELAQTNSRLNSTPVVPVRSLDSLQILSDLRYFASDTCEGRKPGTRGHQLARERIQMRFRQALLDSFGNSLDQTFVGREINGTTTGINVVGWIKGSRVPDSFIVVSAHYDHLGVTPSGTYYGADDNASGVACLLALARYFRKSPPEYSMVFAAFDREESGLQGARNFVQSFITDAGRKVKMNLNMDMIARSDNNRIYAVGVRHYPELRYLVEETRSTSGTELLMGHDSGTLREDWTNQSDHYAFHLQKIPFLYIGVEDHPDYHRTTDTFARVDPSTYIENCNMVLTMLRKVHR